MIYFDGLEFENEISYDVYLLNKYLSKHYDEDIAIQLLQANNENLDGLARALGENDVEFFSLYFMSDKYVVKDTNTARPLAIAHYELWKLANEIFVEDKRDKALF